MSEGERLIDANELLADGMMYSHGIDEGGLLYVPLRDVTASIRNAKTVDAVPVVHGWWRAYAQSSLVRWKDGEPVFEDRNVYRCCRCYFRTIAKHNYCPGCGAKMDR